MENIASATMTRKIEATTDCVVMRPTLPALRSTLRPSKQPTRAMMKAKTGALMMPTQKVQLVKALCSWRRKAGSVMPRSK